MIRTQISFDKALYERAKRAAKRRGVSLAELCRRSIAEAVGRDDTAHPWMQYIGVVDGDIKVPVGGRRLSLLNGIATRNHAAVQEEHGVVEIPPHREVPRLPAEELAIELLGSLLIRGSELQPIERAR